MVLFKIADINSGTWVVGNINSPDVALVGILILFLFLLVIAIFGYSIYLDRQPNSVSPYSGLPMRFGSEVSYGSTKKILSFLYNKFEYNNRIFPMKKAAVCRETGRIFPNAITWYGKIVVDWTFLQKRHPGHYVSWGSLSEEQQRLIRLDHESLEKFQTDYSSPTSNPSKIEPEYAFTTPGPLYVDINSNTLLGWQEVPETEFEVLIVQKPIQLHRSKAL